jgi:hypothetical protein
VTAKNLILLVLALALVAWITQEGTRSSRTNYELCMTRQGYTHADCMAEVLGR